MQAEFTVILHCMYSQNKMVVAYPYVETSLHSLSLCVLALLYDRFLFFFFYILPPMLHFSFFFCLRKFFFTFLDPFSSLLFFIFNSLLLVLFFQCKPFFFLKKKTKTKTPQNNNNKIFRSLCTSPLLPVLYVCLHSVASPSQTFYHVDVWS